MPIGVTARLSCSVQINHAELASRITQYDHAPTRAGTDSHNAARLAAPNGEVSRQAAAIAFANDFWLMMIPTAAAIPLLLLRRPDRTAAPILATAAADR